MRSRNAKTPSKAEKQRFDDMSDLGCIACIMDGRVEPFAFHPTYRPQIHHMDGWVKQGCHLKAVPLCMWHHNGYTTECNGASNAYLREHLGPSYDKHRLAFRERYGRDSTLIAIVNKYLEEK